MIIFFCINRNLKYLPTLLKQYIKLRLNCTTGNRNPLVNVRECATAVIYKDVICRFVGQLEAILIVK